MGLVRAGTTQQQMGLDSGPATDVPGLAQLTARVMTLAGRGELTALEAELEAARARSAATAPPPWRLALWSAMRALLEGRLEQCDRLAREAADAGRSIGEDDAATHVDVLLVRLRREQDRPAEAEVILRDLLGRHPTLLAGQVAWASLLGQVGRDSQARRELRRLAIDEFAEVRGDPGWLPAMCQLAELAVTVDREAEAGVLYRHLKPFGWRLAVEPMAAACHGSVSFYLALLSQALGRWDEAEAHFEDALEAHAAAGAPILAAHTQGQYAALLRTRDRDDDWDRAVALLAQAENIYRRLGIDGRAGECQALLARSTDPATVAPDAENVWRFEGGAWQVCFDGGSATLQDTKGLRDLTSLVNHPGRSFHVADLWGGTRRGVGRAGTNGSGLGRRPGGVNVRFLAPEEPNLDDQTRAECQARLDELESELEAAVRRDDRIAIAIARAEQDIIAGELAAEATGEDPVARVRRLVTLRMRREVDRVSQAHPALGRHLRDSVRTGTFCAYEPPAPTSWTT
jgi:hypothetical protein